MDNFFGSVGQKAMSFADRLADAVKSPEPVSQKSSQAQTASSSRNGGAGTARSSGESRTDLPIHESPAATPTAGKSRAMLVIQERDMLRDFVRSKLPNAVGGGALARSFSSTGKAPITEEEIASATAALHELRLPGSRAD